MILILYLKEIPDGIVFKVRVQPRASKNSLAGIWDDTLKIHLTAPPVDGKANEACRAFLAGLLCVPRSQIEILTGATGRNKTVRVLGVGKEQALTAFAQHG